jgi:hypothetical protein
MKRLAEAHVDFVSHQHSRKNSGFFKHEESNFQRQYPTKKVCLKILKAAKTSPMSPVQAGTDFLVAPEDKQVRWTEHQHSRRNLE